jgi:hypothetical protein
MSTKTESSKRVRHVYPSDMVAHLWANQSQDEAYTSSRNCSFSGPVLRSYSTPIAVIVEHDGKTAALISTDTYSVTTTGHQSDARRAARHLAIVGVPFISRYWPASTAPEDYRAEFARRIGLRSAAVKSARSRPSKACRLAELDSEISAANKLCEFFGLPTFRAEVDGMTDSELQAIRDYGTERDARMRETYETRSAARREANRLKWANESKFRSLSPEEQSRLWIERDPIAPHRLGYGHRFQYMRLTRNRQTIETSNGATVPTSHVRRIAPLILRLLRSGAVYNAQDAPDNVRIGHFSLSSIDADGTVKVGCHTFSRSEIERVAAMLDTIPEA